MKKVFSILLLVLILSTALIPTVLAADYYLVYDEAAVFTENQDSELEERAREISDKYGLDVLIITTDDMYGYDDSQELAMDIFDEDDFGQGSDKSGVMLLLCVADRDVALIAHGYGNVAFTDYGKDVMLDKYVMPKLKDDKYYEACSVFLNKAEEFLSMAEDGEPFDVDTDPSGNVLIKLAIVFLLPLLIALGICLMWKSQMKTAKIARTAAGYIPAGGFNLTSQQDQFLYRTETRTKIEKNPSSSKGGTTTNSKGYSGSSRKY